MGTRALATVVTAAALSSALTAAIVQVTLASPAGAASPTPTPTSAVSLQKAQLKSQLRTEDTQVAILKELQQIDGRLGNVNSRLLNTNTGVANLNTRVLNANDQLAKLVAANDLLIQDAPSAIQGQRARQGYIPQLLYVLDDFCINAEESHYGQSSAPGLRIGC